MYVSRASDTLSQRVPATWLCGMCLPDAGLSFPLGRRNYRYLLLRRSSSSSSSSFFCFFVLFFCSSASISSSSVRRRNNLIPYSRGGCRPWRIEWNKIKPRIPRVLWRGSFPTHFGNVRACLHNRVLLSSRLVPYLFCWPYSFSWSFFYWWWLTSDYIRGLLHYCLLIIFFYAKWLLKIYEVFYAFKLH